MCINPNYTYVNIGPVPQKVNVPCRNCWRCRSNRVNDYVGRSLAEMAFSDWTTTLTLTYAPRDDLADKILTPKHFQIAIMRLRNANHKIRYLVCGEYGELRGRAHFHVILFGKGKRLEIPHKQKCWPFFWDHGHVFADNQCDERSLRYVCKYLLSEEKHNAWFSLSKKPPLGHEFFQRKAARSAELGVLPSTFEYRPPGSHAGRSYLIKGATRRDYIAAIVDEWRKHRPLDKKRLSEWALKAVEKLDYDRAVAAALARPLEDQFQDLKDRLDAQRPTERQVNRKILDGVPETMPDQ